MIECKNHANEKKTRIENLKLTMTKRKPKNNKVLYHVARATAPGLADKLHSVSFFNKTFGSARFVSFFFCLKLSTSEDLQLSGLYWD